jgi:hypothetical protein
MSDGWTDTRNMTLIISLYLVQREQHSFDLLMPQKILNVLKCYVISCLKLLKRWVNNMFYKLLPMMPLTIWSLVDFLPVNPH